MESFEFEVSDYATRRVSWCKLRYQWLNDEGSVTELEYEGFEWQSREDLVKALSGNDAQQIRAALYSAAQYESDWEWAQAQCLTFLHHREFDVRWAAALSLGFIALYQRKLDLAKVLPALYAAKKEALLAPHVEDSLDMIRQYIKTN